MADRLIIDGKEIELSKKTVKNIKVVLEPKEEKKAKTEIKNQNGGVIYTSNKETVKEAVEEAIEREANLRGANLEEADLREANLRGANLEGANLEGAELHNAKFYGRGGTSKLKKDQVEDFLNALGFQIED